MKNELMKHVRSAKIEAMADKDYIFKEGDRIRLTGDGSNRVGTFLYNMESDLQGKRFYSTMVEFDDNKGFESDIAGYAMDILYEGEWYELSEYFKMYEDGKIQKNKL